MKNQGRWTCWGSVQGRSLGWRDIWGMEENRIKFLLCSTYDVLPTPVNLHRWGLVESPNCTLCGKPASLEHVLSSCQASLADGKFRWRHDQILAELATGLEEERRKTHNITRTVAPHMIRFVRAGESSRATSTGSGILTSATDWDMRVDLRRQLKFPEEITISTLRPDIVLWSRATKQVVLLELTVPWEERIEEAHERKLGKYQPLTQQCQQVGWRAWNLPVEVGCRGFPGQSLWSALSRLGIKGPSRRRLMANITKRAETASRWLWLKRCERWNSPPGREGI